jgi:hypothetical protein
MAYLPSPNTYKLPNGSIIIGFNKLSIEQQMAHGYEPVLAPEPVVPTPGELAEQFKQACMSGLQNLLDTTARQYGYDSIHTAIAWGPDRPYGAELKAWGKACWEKAEEIQNAVLAEERDMPESVEAFLSEMPVFEVA